MMNETYLVHGQRSIVSNNTCERRQEAPGVRTPRQRSLLVPHLSTTPGAHKRPDQNRNPRNRHDDALSHEQPPQLIRMHDQKRHTAQPEDEEANHGRSIDALTLWNAVVQRKKRRPDGTYHDAHGIRAVHVLDGKPENGKDGT
jgi:hypothetical protein